MKTRSSSAFLLLAVLGAALASPLAAVTSSSPAIASYRVRAVERDGLTIIRPGDSATKVVAYLGRPDRRLSSDNWVYQRLRAAPAGDAAEENCTALLVSFRDGRVVELRGVNEPAVKALATRLAVPRSPRQVIAGN